MGRYRQSKENKPAGVIPVLLVILLVVIGGAWFYIDRQLAQEAEQEASLKQLPPIDEQPLIDMESAGKPPDEPTFDNEFPEAAEEPIPLQQNVPLPQLADSDGPFRDALLEVTPGLANWLATGQLIKKFMLVANDFSQGLVIEKHMRFLKPSQTFEVVQKENLMLMSAKSYQRFDRLAAVIDSLDTESLMAVYIKFRPLLNQVYTEFSYPEQYRLEDIFTKAAAEILKAPVMEGPIAVIRPSVSYQYADKKIEALSPVSKQMLRMGPKNTLIIQNKVRRLVEQLTILYD